MCNYWVLKLDYLFFPGSEEFMLLSFCLMSGKAVHSYTDLFFFFFFTLIAYVSVEMGANYLL